MPSFFDVCMIDGIWNVLPSRIRFEMAGVVSRISRAATRPPPIFLQRVCEMTPRSAQCVLERVGVDADLALRDDAALVRVYELDRVLDRDDVVGAHPVDQIDQRAERRRLSRAGRSGDENEPF